MQCRRPLAACTGAAPVPVATFPPCVRPPQLRMRSKPTSRLAPHPASVLKPSRVKGSLRRFAPLTRGGTAACEGRDQRLRKEGRAGLLPLSRWSRPWQGWVPRARGHARAGGAQNARMLAQVMPRRPAPMLARGAPWLRPHVRPTAFGNALGNGLVDAMTTQNTAQESFRQSEIRQQNAEHEWRQAYFHRNEFDREDDRAVVAQQRREAMYGLAGPVRFGAPKPDFAEDAAARRGKVEVRAASAREALGIATAEDRKLLFGSFPAWDRFDTRLPIAGPSALTSKLDGSPATYTFNRSTGDVYWDFGAPNTVSPIPLAFKRPTWDEAVSDPTNSWMKGPRLGDALTGFGLTTATGVAGLFTGGWAFGAMRAAGYGALASGGTAGFVGDLTTQFADNGVRLGTGGKYGRSGIDGTELLLSAGLGALPGLPGAVRGWAQDLRGLGVPDWNIRFASVKPGVFYSNPVPLEFERIGQELSGPVVFKLPRAGATAEEIAQMQAYVDGSNEALRAGYLSPSGRVSTTGELRTDASLTAAQERARAAAAGASYQGHAGHVPDTTWTNNPVPYSWLDLSPSVNSSLGSQAKRYPIGYKPTEFILEKKP